MLQRIRDYILQTDMINYYDFEFEGTRRIVVGLSGGADSVCLLLVLKELQEEFEYDLVAVHVNHCIRGEEANRDENFCRDLCERLNVPLHVVTRDVPEYAREHHLSLEEAGRIIRYEAFIDELESFEGWSYIAVAHHKNDNAETVLFNMARGSALSGIVGMRPYSMDLIIRPLLCVSREEIEEFLAKRGQDYCVDSTNAHNDYSRNLIRNEILPLLLQINSACVENISQLSAYLFKVEKFIDNATDEAMERVVKFQEDIAIIDEGELEDSDELIQDNILYSVICNCAGYKKDIERVHVEYLKEFIFNDCNTGKQIDLPYGVIAKKEYDTVLVGKAFKEKEYDWELLTFTDESSYETFVDKFSENYLGKKFCTIDIDYDKIKCGLVLRPRESCDYMVINVDGRRKDVNRIFIDDKVPVSSRNVPIVFDGSEAVWICGKRRSPRYKYDENSVSKAIVVIVGSNLE